MKNLILLILISFFVLVACGKEEEVKILGPRVINNEKSKSEVTDHGPSNIGSSGLGGGGGGAPSSNSTGQSAKKSGYAEHNTEDDCYTRIGSKVYDITELISEFPDISDQLISMCGEDTTAFYNNKLSSNTEFVAALEGMEVK